MPSVFLNGIYHSVILARGPKQCVVRILKGKVERAQKHQWLQASRTKAAIVVKTWCSFSRWSLEEEIPEGILQVPCVDIDDLNDPEI